MASNTTRRQQMAKDRRERSLKAKEKKLIDAVVRDEDTSDKKLGILRSHPYYKASVKRAKREAEVREDRAKKKLPPETIFEKARRQGEERRDAAKQKPTKKPGKTAAQMIKNLYVRLLTEFLKKNPLLKKKVVNTKHILVRLEEQGLSIEEIQQKF